MDEQEVFAHLQKQKKAVLLDYLHAAFDEMTAKQRRAVFADAVRLNRANSPRANLEPSGNPGRSLITPAHRGPGRCNQS